MRVELIAQSDIPELLGWWNARGDAPLDAEVLPPVGVVARDDCGQALAAAWIYQPAFCRVAILDWLVIRPGMLPGKSRKAGRAVLAELERMATAGGATRLFVSVTRDGMAREALSCNFSLAAVDCVHLIKSLS
jgi:hypothetical protein